MPLEINPRMLEAEPMQRCKLHECRGACCLYGVWLDTAEVELIRAHAAEIAQAMPEEFRDPGLWLDEREDQDPHSHSGRVFHSRVVPDPLHYGRTACIFMRGDWKCALQVASQAAGLHPWAWKPFYCILHPLDLDDSGRITLDETRLLVAEEGSCLRPSIERIPLIETFEEELRYFLGDDAYEALRPRE